jgi:hypothetical protein
VLALLLFLFWTKLPVRWGQLPILVLSLRGHFSIRKLGLTVEHLESLGLERIQATQDSSENQCTHILLSQISTNSSPEREAMTPDEITNIATELKRLGGELNLNDSQKEQLRNFLTEKYEQLQEYKKHNPNLSKEDIIQYIAKNRSAAREKIEKFLTPDQLKIWDAEVAKAKDFLSQRAASA